jgi:hypothetical protein
MSKFLRLCARAPRQGARDGRGRRCQRGAETVELAVTLAFFMLVLFSFLIGIFLMYDYNAIAYLAREGVYYAVRRGAEADAATSPVRDDAPARADTIEGYIRAHGLLSPTTVTAQWADCDPLNTSQTVKCIDTPPTWGALSEGVNNQPGDWVRVTVTYSFQPRLLDSIWPATINLSSTAQGTLVF